MRKLVLILLLITTGLFSQQSQIIELSNKNLNIKSNETSSVNAIVSTFNSGITYFITKYNYNHSNYRQIYRYNEVSGLVDSIQIDNSKHTKNLIHDNVFSIAVADSTIILLTDKFIYLFEVLGNKITNTSTLTNKYSFNQIRKLSNNEYFLYVNYNFHPADSPHRHLWGKLLLKERMITDLKRMDESNAIFSHFIHQWFSIYNGLIAYSLTTDYKIYFYDTNFSKIDSICSNRLDSNQIYLNEIRSQNNYTKEGINAMLQKDEVLLKRIQKIFLLDSTHLLVMVKLPSSPKCLFDIWLKAHDKWELSSSTLVSNFYEVNQTYTNNNELAEGFFGNVNGIGYNGNNEFTIVYFPFIDNIETKSFDLDKDYNSKINKMIKENNLSYGVRKYKIKTD